MKTDKNSGRNNTHGRTGRLAGAAAAFMALLMLASCAGTGTGTTSAGTTSAGTTSAAGTVAGSTAAGTGAAGVTASASDAIMGNFSVNDINGKNVDQSILKGHKLTMVNIWATFCSPCLSEMPELGELATENADKGVQIIGVVSDVVDAKGNALQKKVANAQSLVAKTGADYTHLVPTGPLAKLLTLTSVVPTTIFVDENGVQVGQTLTGARGKADWQAVIDRMLLKAAG